MFWETLGFVSQHKSPDPFKALGKPCILVKSGLAKIIGTDNIHVRTAEAYEDCLAHVGKSPMQDKVSLQYK